MSKGNCGQVCLWEEGICELYRWLGRNTHTQTDTRTYERMGSPRYPAVSDLCGAITQVTQWVTVTDTQFGAVAVQRRLYQSVTTQSFTTTLYSRLWGCHTSHSYVFAPDKVSNIVTILERNSKSYLGLVQFIVFAESEKRNLILSLVWIPRWHRDVDSSSSFLSKDRSSELLLS